jgi:hypothetical protein
MTITYSDNVQEQLPTASQLAYTTGTVNSAHIIYATVHNESTANVTIIVNIVQSGGTAGVTNQYVSRTIAADTSVVLNEIINRVLKTGDTIYATAGTADALNLSIGVKEIST